MKLLSFFALLQLGQAHLLAPQGLESRALHHHSARISIPVPRSLNLTQLSASLSPNASVFTSSSPQWDNATERYSATNEPQFSVVVEPGVEADVAKTVQFANTNNMTFMTVNRGHGNTVSLDQMRGGIEIYVRVLNNIVINTESGTALMQGGVYDDQVISTLWDAGYVTVTGSCGCAGLLGPGPGGGFGRYMGFYGLVADNLRKMNVVIANGTEIQVSESQNPDLYWAMRGAGHNFGIITSFTMPIYEKTVDTWFYAEYVYTSDKLEAVFEAVNELNANGTQPKEIITGLEFSWDVSVDSSEALIALLFYYVGTPEQAAPYTAPFNSIGPTSLVNDSVPYPEVAEATGTGSGNPLCAFGYSRIQKPLGLFKYDIPTQRMVYEYFKNSTAAQPEFQNTSAIVMENYSTVGVKAISSESSAYPHRSDNIIVNTNINYEPDPSLDASALEIANYVKALLQAGQRDKKPTAYVNYAYGDEPREQMYGYDPWRMEKLRAVKAAYDPENKFRYYNPIIQN